MAYPKITLNNCTYAQITQNKTGDLAMVYKPLQNLIQDSSLGDFTTDKLNFNRYNAQDMIIVDEFDGSTNIIINDDQNNPKLINSGFAVQEDNTFLIPEHYTNVVENIYNDETFKEDTQLFKLYTSIPSVEFLGLGEGSFNCGSYVFYFRLADSHGNMSNVIQHSSIVQVPVGELGTYKLRMGMEDNVAGKSIKFRLQNIDSGFDYVRVFYERTSSGNDQAASTLFYMIDQNFPIVNNCCDITLIGEEQVLPISIQDLKNEYADIASCKTQTVVDNTLFLANTSAFVHKYNELQKIAWTIYTEQVEETEIDLPTYSEKEAVGYYDMKNVYYNVGYWPEEYYRFGIVFVYDNNQLSPVFNIQGRDMQVEMGEDNKNKFWNKPSDPAVYEFHDSEPDDYFFNKDFLYNSKGVVKFKKSGKNFNRSIGIKFNLEGISKYIEYSQDLRDHERNLFNVNGSYSISKFLSERHGIKGFFFVRQKRIPTTFAEGLVIGLTTKEHGCIPILNNNGAWTTKSFLSKDRLVLSEGSDIYTYNDDDHERVVTKALLVPDAELQEATFNSIFTSQNFALRKVGHVNFDVENNSSLWKYRKRKEDISSPTNYISSKLTAVPKDTKLKTNGSDYFSSIAGSAEEAFKTEDIYYVWNKTKPQDLTTSGSLIRGKWGYYVGMSFGNFNFGDIVEIKKEGFATNYTLQNELEFQNRFSDHTFYSPISTRYSVFDIKKEYIEYGGDCFPSVFTHRMMTNFIDPELPTNNKIVNPGCWCENYAVRCTAQILADTSSNLVGESAGFYINVTDNKSSIVSLIFGILTGNLGTIITSIKKLVKDPVDPEQEEYANEVAQAFELYVGDTTKEDYTPPYIIGEGAAQTAANDYKTNALQKAASEGKIKKVNPKEQEQNASGFNLKALFKSDDNWELHGISQINRADINAVALGQWITFPIRSSMNLALRDIDFSNATEEAQFNKKRSFYPLEEMDASNPLPDSNVINYAAKKTVHKNNYPVYKTVPFIKQEYFNRIYWSKPNVSESFLNSFRMVYTDQYKEYNKEFGDITKILPLGNSLFVCFDHGMGILPVDRSIKTETEASPYLASRNVLPAQVTTLSKDFGSMWKNSVIQTPRGLIYGVDTIAKKIWRTNGEKVEFISDHVMNKFLNEFIVLSEFDYKEYQGHIDVKTHYNNFKNDVIFTFVKDIPTYIMPDDIKRVELKRYIQDVWGMGSQDDVSLPKDIIPNESGNCRFDIYFGHDPNVFFGDYEGDQIEVTQKNDPDINGKEDISKFTSLQKKSAEIQNGKIYINDVFTGIWCDVKSWKPGTVWSLCYNEVLQKWITFYDWYPVESCNVDNIYFSFDQEQIDDVYDLKNQLIYRPDYSSITELIGPQISNKYFIDKTFSDKVLIYRTDKTFAVQYPWFQQNSNERKETFISFYFKHNKKEKPYLLYAEYVLPSSENDLNNYMCEDGWIFVVAKADLSKNMIRIVPNGETDFAEIKIFQLHDSETWDDQEDGTLGYASKQRKEPDHLKYYEIRDYNPSRMLLWKHGQAGLYDNQGKIKPTHWYGKQHEFNFEFVVNELPQQQKIFNNLKLISNKIAPDKFEYEIVGEGYDWFEYKPIVEWVNKKAEEDYSKSPNQYKNLDDCRDTIFLWLLNQTSRQISSVYPDFPKLFDQDRVIHKLPYLKMKHTDKKGTPERPHYKWDNGTDYWGGKPYDKTNQQYTYNCSEPCLVEDDQLNEVRIRTESLGNDIRKYGRIRGNMQYLEDLWNVEIRPVQITWCYLDNKGELQTKKVTETKHRDKYIKVKVRYSGEDLALIQAIYTIFDESYA